MVTFLKRGKDEKQIAAESLKVKKAVEEILLQIEEKGHSAVLELAEKFDGYVHETLRLTEHEIQEAISKVPPEDIDDIKFAQAQIRHFAEKQRECIKDLEIETIPGVILGHKNIPVNSVGCYVPGGKYPMVASAHMSVITAKVAGVKNIICCSSQCHLGKTSAATIQETGF